MIYKINLIDLVQVLTLLSTIFHLYRGRQFYWEESHRNYPLDYMKEKRTLQGNITQAPSMKKWGQEMDFLVLQSNNITKYNDVK
jgi:hypothetical protein